MTMQKFWRSSLISSSILRGGDGVERRTGLVHQDHVRVHRDGARDAQALLLPAGEAGAGMVEAVLHLFPQARLADTLFHNLVELGLAARHAMNARAIGDVLVDRLGEGIGLLEHHADAGAELHHIDLGVIDVLVVDHDLAGDTAGGDRVVHAVDGAQEGGLAAARRPDEGRDCAVRNVDRQVLDGVLVAVMDIDVAGRDLYRLSGEDAWLRRSDQGLECGWRVHVRVLEVTSGARSACAGRWRRH